MHRRAEEINETAKQWVRHRGLKLVFHHAEVVKCDILPVSGSLVLNDMYRTQRWRFGQAINTDRVFGTHNPPPMILTHLIGDAGP